MYSLLALTLLSAGPRSSGPLVSGLQPGQRPGPYTALVSVGPQRGQLHCFVCETADRPAVIVFARTFARELGPLVRGIDRALAEHPAVDPRAWVTFLADDQSALDPRVVKWAQDQAIRGVPLAVFEDAAGPPAYRLHADADVTVLLSVKQKVVRNYSFRAGELTAGRVRDVLAAVTDLLKKK